MLRLLPHRGRRGGPGGGPRRSSALELGRWREEIARVYEGAPEHPAGQRLQVAVRRFPIPRAALEEIIAGVEMDMDHPTYETFDALYPYCYRVASAVGLCCIEIFGYSDPRAREYAVNLGVALQITNILRDVQVDARIGRVYLPQEDLRALRRDRGGSGAGPLHARVRPAHDLRGGARPRVLRSARGRRCPRRTRAGSSRPRSWAAPTSRCCGPSRRAASTSSPAA